jgi:CubicO group peptidase (beta-lactamase class C family)
MRKLLIVFILALLAHYQAFTQNLCLPEASPSLVGIDEQRLGNIDKYLEDLTNQKKIQGAVLLLARKGKVFHFKSLGQADWEKKLAMDKNAIFRIKSMSKPITSVAAMILIEEGKMRLDEPISKYLPEFKNSKVAINKVDSITKKTSIRTIQAEKEISVRDLMTHTSGIIYGWLYPGTLGDIWKAKDNLEFTNIANLSKSLATLPLAFQPGGQWMYGRSTDILGRLIEVVSGLSFDKFLKERIFDPLGMEDTYFELPAEKTERLVPLYIPDAEGKLIKAKSHNDLITKGLPPSALYMGGKRTLFTGGEGLVSTAADYLRFCTMMMNNGQLDGKRILSRKSIELMLQPHVTNIQSPNLAGYDFGLGFAVHTNPAKSLALGTKGEYYWGGAFNTSFWIDPKEEFIGIIMLQIDPYNYLNILKQFKNLAYQSLGD